MKRTVTNLLDIARAELGYHEKKTNANLDQKTAPNDGAGNYTKYGRDLYAAGYYNGNKNGYAWCDQFVDWNFYQLCGKDAKAAQAMQYQSGPLGAGCVYSAGYYEDAGHYGQEPKVGAQIFFGDFDHTGIVEDYDGTYVTTIEGNKNNQVSRCKYRRGDPYITGYGYPNFEAEDESEPETPAQPTVETLAKGDRVAVASGAKTYTGGGLASWVYATEFTVIEADGDRVVIGLNGVVTAAMNAKNLKKLSGTATQPPDPVPALKVGDRVRLTDDAVVYGTNTRLSSWVYGYNLFVREVDGDRIVVSAVSTGPVTGAVERKHLRKI